MDIFIKLLNSSKYQDGIKYIEGLNIDPLFDGSENPGLSFIKLEDIFLKISPETKYIRQVILPADAITNNINYSNKIILLEKYTLDNLIFFNNPELVEKILNKTYSTNPFNKYLILKYIKNQTDKICELAVQYNGLELEFAQIKTDNIYQLAVQQNGLSLEFIPNKTKNICLAAVKNNGLAIQYIPEILCLEYNVYPLAVQQNGSSIKYINQQNKKICKLAVKQNGMALEYINKEFKTDTINYIAVSQNGAALQFVPYQTELIALRAVQNCYYAYNFINISLNPSFWYEIKYDKKFVEFIKKNKNYLKNITNQYKKLCKLVTKININQIRFIQDKKWLYYKNGYYWNINQNILDLIEQDFINHKTLTEQEYLKAVKKRGYYLKYIQDQTEQICKEAVKQNGLALQYVKNQTDQICSMP